MKVIWLASYPKSGNTFIRMLLHTYLFGPLQDSDEIGERIPDLHLMLSQKKNFDLHNDKITIVKTHFCLSNNHPYEEATAGFIYILRNPRDVLLSNARYFGVDRNLEELRKFSITFINSFGMPSWRQMDMGSWPEHLASWLYSTNKIPHIFIKYEDLRINTASTLKNVVNFLGETPDDSKIHTAVSFCTIEKARLFEKEEKKHGRKNIYIDLPNNASFVGDGKISQSLTFMGDDIEKLYQEKFGRFINIFGY